MIYAKLQGRIGNIMFIAAAAATIAKNLDTKVVLCCHRDYKLAGGKYIWDYVQEYKDTILKKFEIRESLPEGLPTVEQPDFGYSELKYPSGDFILSGSFQAYKYIDRDIAEHIFDFTTIRHTILAKNAEAFSKPIISVHVRRGDYCIIPHKFPPVSVSYIRRAMKAFPKNSRFLFISDDMDYCKKHFKGKNIYYINRESPLCDMYAPALCDHNIISNSSFTWWGAFLNPNPNKIVIAPKPWFGKYETRILDKDALDLVSPSWKRLKNNLEFRLWLRATRMGLFTDLGIIK